MIADVVLFSSRLLRVAVLSCSRVAKARGSSLSVGAIEHVKMKLDKQSNTRIAFIEFKTNDAAKTALGMCGAQPVSYTHLTLPTILLV